MKDLLVNSIMKNIERYNDFDESKLKIIRYGLASLYLHLSKLIAIFTAAYFLGLFKTLLIMMTLYSILRLTGFGVHAKKSLHCWIASLTTFLVFPYLCENIEISLIIKVITAITLTILLAIYAPADTEKRPLIHKKKRITYKIITTLISIFYTISLFLINNNTISNCILFAIITEVIVVLPITYKIFGVKYNNYQDYEKKKKRGVNN